MSRLEKDALIENALNKFNHINSIQSETARRLSSRVTFLYRTMFIGFGLVVAALFFMVLVMSTQMYHMTGVINIMNTHFTSMNDDMNGMLLAMGNMDKNVDSMVTIVREIDSMNGNVDAMSEDMGLIYARMDIMDVDIEQLSYKVTDMRESFKIMNSTMGNMDRNVQHMTGPMKLFNSINPFR